MRGLGVEAMGPRSSASRMRSWPSLARRMTTRVTAFLGSLAVAPERALRLVAGFFALRFAMVAGIVLQSGEKKSGGEPPHFAGLRRSVLRRYSEMATFRRACGPRRGC